MVIRDPTPSAGRGRRPGHIAALTVPSRPISVNYVPMISKKTLIPGANFFQGAGITFDSCGFSMVTGEMQFWRVTNRRPIPSSTAQVLYDGVTPTGTERGIDEVTVELPGRKPNRACQSRTRYRTSRRRAVEFRACKRPLTDCKGGKDG